MITINPDPDNPNRIYTCRIPENDILWVDITKTELIRRLNEYWKWFRVYHEGKLNIAISFMIDNYLWSNDDKPLKKDYVMRGI